MPVIKARSGATHELDGVRFTTLASPSTGAHETSVWQVELEPDVAPVPHHLTREEILVATAGRATATLDGQRVDVAPGDTIVVPAGTAFSLAACGPEAFCAVALLPVGGLAVTPALADGFTPPWAR